MQIRAFSPADTDAVIELWNACGLTRPWNDPRLDIERKLTVQPELFLVGVIPSGTDAAGARSDTVIASVMAGFDGHRGWVNYLAVTPDEQGLGLGRVLMSEVERLLEEKGCPKVNLQVRADNAAAFAFYEALGYTQDVVASFGKRLIAD
ncbi:GNAT family acetyltransferase [Leifsonia sp. A12D58]|uniref:GNAT family acetyltransferase n=1 Tax=Leifsonia sp. A12D58 TaxID=3397674 RepID=UPI0039DF84C7